MEKKCAECNQTAEELEKEWLENLAFLLGKDFKNIEALLVVIEGHVRYRENQLLTSKSEQMEREKIGKNHYVKELTSEDYYGFNAGISKCIEILKK